MGVWVSGNFGSSLILVGCKMGNSTSVAVSSGAMGVVVVVVVIVVLAIAAATVVVVADVGTAVTASVAAVSIWIGTIGLSPIRTALLNSTAWKRDK